jgi:hypothetical protein
MIDGTVKVFIILTPTMSTGWHRKNVPPQFGHTDGNTESKYTI